MNIKLKSVLYAIVAVLIITGAYFFISTVPNTNLGSAVDTQGSYTLKTSTSGESVICAVPCVLHRIIFGTANDVLTIANSAVTGSGASTFTITATVPQSFDFETTYSSGLTAYVTSANGILFVTSPR